MCFSSHTQDVLQKCAVALKQTVEPLALRCCIKAMHAKDLNEGAPSSPARPKITKVRFLPKESPPGSAGAKGQAVTVRS